jgi:hypothetical protein
MKMISFQLESNLRASVRSPAFGRNSSDIKVLPPEGGTPNE